MFRKTVSAIMLSLLVLGTLTLALTTQSVKAASAQVYFDVQPVAVPPLTNILGNANGLETPSAPSPVGQDFTVQIHLLNATTLNVPAGVAGVEVIFSFGNILKYCMPIGFITMFGQPSGVFNGTPSSDFLYVLNGFYDNADNRIPAPPYTNATQYMVAGITTSLPGNSADGLVAEITFQITGQPLQNMSQPDFYAPLQISYGEVDDIHANEIASSIVRGTLIIDRATSLVGDLNGDGKVGLDDLVLLANAYGSHCANYHYQGEPASPNWNPNADLALPYGIIGLTDLVTLAMYYGQGYQAGAVLYLANINFYGNGTERYIDIGNSGTSDTVIIQLDIGTSASAMDNQNITPFLIPAGLVQRIIVNYSWQPRTVYYFKVVTNTGQALAWAEQTPSTLS